eukprot:XP_014775464.1 PREDICTED: probable serine/threonine-protein kinase roco9 [Octopus bimaculoides]
MVILAQLHTKLELMKNDVKAGTTDAGFLKYNCEEYLGLAVWNLAKSFFKILDSNFPRQHKYHSIFNGSTLKLSYSTTPSFEPIIATSNKHKLSLYYQNSHNYNYGNTSTQRMHIPNIDIHIRASNTDTRTLEYDHNRSQPTNIPDNNTTISYNDNNGGNTNYNNNSIVLDSSSSSHNISSNNDASSTTEHNPQVSSTFNCRSGTICPLQTYCNIQMNFRYKRIYRIQSWEQIFCTTTPLLVDVKRQRLLDKTTTLTKPTKNSSITPLKKIFMVHVLYLVLHHSGKV